MNCVNLDMSHYAKLLFKKYKNGFASEIFIYNGRTTFIFINGDDIFLIDEKTNKLISK